MMKNYYLCTLFYLLIGTAMINANSSCMQEITLVECAITPMDDSEDAQTDPTPPTRFRATISGHDLFVSANTNRTAHVIVENNSTGEIVEEKAFVASTPVNIPQRGNYTLYLISDDTTAMGEFSVGE